MLAIGKWRAENKNKMSEQKSFSIYGNMAMLSFESSVQYSIRRMKTELKTNFFSLRRNQIKPELVIACWNGRYHANSISYIFRVHTHTINLGETLEADSNGFFVWISFVLVKFSKKINHCSHPWIIRYRYHIWNNWSIRWDSEQSLILFFLLSGLVHRNICSLSSFFSSLSTELSHLFHFSHQHSLVLAICKYFSQRFKYDWIIFHIDYLETTISISIIVAIKSEPKIRQPWKKVFFIYYSFRLIRLSSSSSSLSRVFVFISCIGDANKWKCTQLSIGGDMIKLMNPWNNKPRAPYWTKGLVHWSFNTAIVRRRDEIRISHYSHSIFSVRRGNCSETCN